MKIWKHSARDAFLLLFSVMQLVMLVSSALLWSEMKLDFKVVTYFVLIFMMTYNIIVVSHLFTHTPWFISPFLNSMVSILNSINIGQSVKAYHLKHVRNHHRYNNDQVDSAGYTKDFSSTFLGGKNNDHISVFQYAFVGAILTFLNYLKELSLVIRWWPKRYDTLLLSLTSKSPIKSSREMLQVKFDRFAIFCAFIIFLIISWHWTIFCFLPTFYLSLALVNIQNYYEHYGALPSNKAANSVSYYGKIYNALTFNDGYHQEHHLRSGSHWTEMPIIRETYEIEMETAKRIVSPVPAILGFLHKNRVQLHRVDISESLEKKKTGEGVIYDQLSE